MHCHSRYAPPRLRTFGYSLIELVTTLLVLGILAGVAAPKYYHSLSIANCDAAARRIAADINLVRARGMMIGRQGGETITFYPELHRYQAVSDPDLDREDEEYWVDLTSTPYPVKIASVAFTNTLGNSTQGSLRFDIYGNAWCGDSAVAPLASGQIVVQSGVHQKSVVIDPVTGKAYVP
ncbi:pilus assembly FimT family protein [Aeoliella mucimassa]|uniref:General secretion pathway GspH domain-containing protein n=1 Tax=Aeoliella mucimassa TaxID=2527972 RepID=A0A518ART6_9BACT|nr:type II secretion system protein [Aeoliella mucimassa]QDU57435.1 hypothetical protein Pan181_36510 [Aeoliella mucimassa]